MAAESQIVKYALVRAGVVAYDQVPEAEQEAQALAALRSLYQYWFDQGMALWTLTDIPATLDSALADVLAFEIANTFGVSSERYQRLALGRLSGLRQIAAHNEIRYDGLGSSISEV